MDDITDRLDRLASELDAMTAEQAGEIDVDVDHDEVTLSGDRIGFIRLAADSLRASARTAASPPPPSSASRHSPITAWRRIDLEDRVEPAALPRWKDRLLTAGCFLAFAFAALAFFRGCAALQSDVQRFFR